MIEALPGRLQYTPKQWHETDPSRAVMTAHVHLDFLYNEFMLRRLLYSLHRENHSELLSLSQHMLTIVLEASNIRACQSPAADHIPWIVVLYGLPPAGLLAVELLRRRDQNDPDRGALIAQRAAEYLPNIAGQPVHKKFSWTQALQDLAVFNSILKWIHLPWEGNYELANEAHQSLQRVLRKVLSIDESIRDEQLQNTAASDEDGDVATVGGENLVSLQQLEAQNQSPLYSRPQDVATENLDWDITMGFDVDFWMDLPDSIPI